MMSPYRLRRGRPHATVIGGSLTQIQSRIQSTHSARRLLLLLPNRIVTATRNFE